MSFAFRIGFIVTLTLLATLFVAGFQYPLYDQCDTSLNSIVSHSGLSMCNDGSFITSLAMGLTGTASLTNFNDQPSPIYTPHHIYQYIQQQASLAPVYQSAFFSNQVVPEFVQGLTNWVHYHGDINQSMDFATICHHINHDDAFYLADTSLSHTHNSVVVLITACDYTYASNSYELTIHHPTYGAMFIDFSDVQSVHEFLVSYTEYQRQYNIQRITSPNGHLMVSVPQYDAVSEALQAIPFNYPTYFKQCDSRWANDIMTTKTVCQVGCLMNSICAGVRGHGVKVSGSACDPKVFNKWLRANGGYTSDLFIHGVVNKLCNGQSNCKSTFPSDGAQGRMSLANVQAMLKKKRVMAANVKNGGHWVLAYGWDNSNPNRILTHDSASADRKWHDLSEVVNWRIYDLIGPNTKATWDVDHDHSDDDDALDTIVRQIGL